MARWRLAATAAIGVMALTLSGPAWAQFDVMRSQVQTIDRAVTRNVERVFKPRLVIREGATGPVTALALSADEHALLTAVGNDTLRLWDMTVGREVVRLPGHGARITGIAIAPDQSVAVTVAADHTVRLWPLGRPETGTTLPTQGDPITSLAFVGPGRLVTASADGRVREWSLPDGTARRELVAAGSGPARVAASGDGSRFASGGADGTVRVWSAVDPARPPLTIAVGGAVTALALTGERIAVATGGTTTLWRGDGTRLGELDTDDTALTSLSFSGDGRRLLSGDGDGEVRLWDAGSGAASRRLGRHDAAVTAVALGRDGSYAISAAEDGSTRLWNSLTGTQVLSLYSTETGWAVVDARGRYDGNQSALAGIDWQADSASANIEDFAETHYEAALLPRSLQPEGAVAAAASIPDGVAYPPKVRLVSSAQGSTARRVQVEVAAEDDGGGVAEIRLFRNGKLVPSGRAEFRQEQNGEKTRLIGRYEIETGGARTELTATALNSQRLESRPQRLALDGAAPPIGRIHLLTVGINRYQDPRLALYYARPDAQAIAEFFSASGRAVAPVDRIDLRDAQASKPAILDALHRLRSVPTEDLVVVYLAGHGVSLGDDWYFLSQEIRQPDRLEDLAAVALSSADLKAEIEALDADRTLLLLDTCHSGSAVMPLREYRGLKSLRLLARSVGTHVLAATDRSQSALEIDRLGHGVFTYALLDGLNGKAESSAGGAVTATQLVRYVEDTVPRLTRDLADDIQYPTGYSRGMDFTLTQSVK